MRGQLGVGEIPSMIADLIGSRYEMISNSSTLSHAGVHGVGSFILSFGHEIIK